MRTEVLSALAAAALAVLGAAWVLQLWKTSLSKPWFYDGDGLFYQAVLKDVIQHGWALKNPDLGAPIGAQFYDFPINNGESAHLLIIKAMALFTGSPFTLANAFFLLTFPLCAVTAYAAMRYLGIARLIAVSCSVLFALAPYHFQRGEGHLFLSGYYAVPLAAVLIFEVLAGRAVWQCGPDGGRVRRWLTRRNAGILVLCALIGSASVYYAAFTVILLALAGLLVAITSRSLRTLVPALTLLVLIAAVVVANQIPTLLYWTQHGVSNAAARRPGDSEYYGLKIVQMLMPVVQHRIGVFDHLSRSYLRDTPVPSEPIGNLGIAASIGFLWLLVVGLAAALSRTPTVVGGVLERRASVLTLLAILVGTVGGFSAIVSYTLTAQLRSWNRISIFIAFFALLALGLLLQRLRDRLARQSAASGRRVFAGVLTVVTVLAVLDQTSPGFTPPHARLQAEYRSDAGFVHRLEASLPRGAMVFELPLRRMPPDDIAPNRLLDYDLLRGYLNSSHLRWNYGGSVGRREDWSRYETMSLPRLLDAAAADGFSAIYEDRFAYGDTVPLEAQLSSLLRVTPLVSADQRLVAWDLRPYAARLARRVGPTGVQALRNATVQPPELTYQSGFEAPEKHTERFRWMHQNGVIVVHNPLPRSREFVFEALAESYAQPASTLNIDWGGRRVAHVTMTVGGAPVSVRLRIPAGDTRLTLSVDGPPSPTPSDPRAPLFARIINPEFFDGILREKRTGAIGPLGPKPVQSP